MAKGKVTKSISLAELNRIFKPEAQIECGVAFLRAVGLEIGDDDERERPSKPEAPSSINIPQIIKPIVSPSQKTIERVPVVVTTFEEDN